MIISRLSLRLSYFIVVVVLLVEQIDDLVINPY